MRTDTLFAQKTVFSFEVFPPKKTSSIETVYRAIDELAALKPDFISVTYGAGGSENSAATLEIASEIKNKYSTESVAHLPCINLTKPEVIDMLHQFEQHGIENIMALRGDITEGVPIKTDFRYASDLTAFIRQHGDFNIIGGCYPEGHPEAPDIETDICNLKIKVDAGVSQLASQLFFDNRFFYDFLDRVAKVGITVPIEAGIMPITDQRQVERIVKLSNAQTPEKFDALIEKYGTNPDEMREAGIDYAIEQIMDLLKNGVDGIHLYTMNKPYVAFRIVEAVKSFL